MKNNRSQAHRVQRLSSNPSLNWRHRLLRERAQLLFNDGWGGGDAVQNVVIRLEFDFSGLWLTGQIMYSM